MKPILLGTVNPYDADPRVALFPAPERSAGYRLWRMLHEVSGAWRWDYVHGFDRRNLVAGEWSTAAARAAAESFTAPAGSTIVLLGSEVARAFGHAPRPIHPYEAGGCVWRQVPHPSGRNTFYNEPEHRLVVGLLLEELLCK